MKKSKKNYVAIVLIVLLLALAVGYAAFSQTLTISGTAKTQTGNWDVKFTNATTTQSVYAADSTDNKATFTNDTVTVSTTLKAPGDGAEITATISNSGSLDAVLTGFEVTSSDGSLVKASDTVYKSTNGDVILTLPTVTKEDDSSSIAAGSAKTFKFTIEWDSDSELTTELTTKYDIKFTYSQDTDSAFTGTQSFN